MAFQPPQSKAPVKAPASLAPTPGKTTVPARTVTSPPKGRPDLRPPRLGRPDLPPGRRVSQTPAQAATAAVSRLLKPQYTQASADAARQNAAINSFTQAVMQQLQGVPGQVQGDYTAAVNGQTALANAAADSLRSANPAQQDQQLLRSINAPQAQIDQLGSHLADTFNGGAAVGQYINGVLPASTLRSQGLTATTLARLQPGYEALRGSQALQGALASQSDARQKIAAQAPGLEQNWLGQFQSNKAKQQQLDYEANALGLKTKQQQFSQNLAVTKLKTQQDNFLAQQTRLVNEFNAKQTTSNRKLALPNASLSAKYGYVVDATGAPVTRNGKLVMLPGNRLVNGRVVKSGTKPKAAPRLSAGQVQKFKGDAETIAANGKSGFVGKDPVTGQPKKFPPLTAAQAWEEMRKHGIPESIALKVLRRVYGSFVGVDTNPATNPNAAGPSVP